MKTILVFFKATYLDICTDADGYSLQLKSLAIRFKQKKMAAPSHHNRDWRIGGQLTIESQAMVKRDRGSFENNNSNTILWH